MYDRFTARGRRVMKLANNNARRRKHPQLGTEHLLIGLLKERDGLAASALSSLGIDLAKTQSAVDVVSPDGPEDLGEAKIPPSSGTKKCILNAFDQVKTLNQSHVDTEHILLGLLRVDNGKGVAVLQQLGVDPAAVQERVLAILNGTHVPEPMQAEPEEEPEEEYEVDADREYDTRATVKKITKNEAITARDKNLSLNEMNIAPEVDDVPPALPQPVADEPELAEPPFAQGVEEISDFPSFDEPPMAEAVPVAEVPPVAEAIPAMAHPVDQFLEPSPAPPGDFGGFDDDEEELTMGQIEAPPIARPQPQPEPVAEEEAFEEEQEEEPGGFMEPTPWGELPTRNQTPELPSGFAEAANSYADPVRAGLVYGPSGPDQAIRQAILLVWGLMPNDRKNPRAVADQIRRLVDRALKDMDEDAGQFNLG